MKFLIKYHGNFVLKSFLQDTKLEDLYVEETYVPYRQEHIDYKAILDPDGKPQVIREIYHTWEPSFEEWCEEGIDHRQEDLNHYADQSYKKYFRKVRRQVLTKDYATLNALMDDIYQHQCSIYFSAWSDEWVLSFGVYEDIFDREYNYDEE